KELIVAMKVRYPLWKAVLDRMKALPAILFVVFLCLMLVIVFINVYRYRQVVQAQRAILLALAALTEFRDVFTGKHLERARNYAMVLAKQLRKNPKYKKIITDEFVDDLYNAAPLHDIGKVATPDSILLKKGKLDDEEYEKMKGHVLIGKHLLQDVIDTFNIKESFVIMARDICAYHHERWDGTGYTEGLATEEIPLAARIFSLCDAYDAITSERVFKGQISHKEALRRIRLARSVQFDPDVVDAFEECRGKFWEISETWK
ncbi:unnamed protein product, partial [marine sediment metagenome]